MAKVDAGRLIAYLQTKWQDRPCPMCGARQWNVQNTSFELREFHGGDMVIAPGPVIPLVPVMCTNCGNTILINCLVAGVDLEGGEKKNE